MANKRSCLLLPVAGCLVCAVIAGMAVNWLWSTYGERLPSKLGSLAIVIAPLPIVLVLTRLLPAQRDQRVFSIGLLQDSIYFLINQALRITLVAFYVGVIRDYYDANLSALTITSVASLPLAIRLVMSVLMADFLGWLHHLLRHKISLFWNFHTIHHSQREMNFFTSTRVHALDDFIAHLIIFIPTYMLQLSWASSFWYGIAVGWYTLIYHANMKTNYGIFRYVLVTPQSHRVHHSSLEHHRDTNFGVLFSIWDHLFGTQYKNYNEYPQTGIDYPDFPMEQHVVRVGFLGTYFAQLVYPLKLMLRRQ